MTPWKDGKANEGPFVRKRAAFAWGLRDPPGPHAQADDPQEHQRPVAGSELGHPRSTTPPASSKRLAGQVRQGLDWRHHLLAPAPTKKTYLVQKLVRAAFGNNNVDTCARVLPLAHGFTA